VIKIMIGLFFFIFAVFQVFTLTKLVKWKEQIGNFFSVNMFSQY